MSRLVIAMSTRKVHRADCRYVVSPGSATSPYADENALRLLKHCGTCKPGDDGSEATP